MVWGVEVYLAGSQLQGGEFIIVISDTAGDILKDYALRWKIETLFGCLKSRGFRLEETHLTHMERLNKLIALLAIAFAWIHRTGEYLIKSGNEIPLKKTLQRPLKSIFRHGFDCLRQVIISLSNNLDFFFVLVRNLSCT
jgi:hypothetical protein